MVKVDLITGFLGVGKTTFIQNYVKYLKEKGEVIHIVENEFADRGVDSAFLHEEADDCCTISDLSGMCMCCIGKKEFIRLLVESAGTGCSRIVVEPSGIYDVDEFFDVLSDPRVSSLCEIGCILTIVDPMNQQQLTEEAKYLMFAQLVASGTIIYSKTQLLADGQLEEAMEWVNQLVIEKGCENGKELRQRVQQLFTNQAYGTIYRVKGYVKCEDGSLYEVNCTGQLMSLETVTEGDEGIVLIGQRLKKNALKVNMYL